MAIPSYKLHYFNIHGLGEIPRLLFAAAGVQFEDVRYGNPTYNLQGPHDYSTLKNSGILPFGQIPLLEVTQDGKTVRIAQSGSISRFLSRRFGLYGDPHCAISGALVDQVYEGVKDLNTAFSKIRQAPEEDKEKAKAEFYGNALSKHLALFNNLIHDGNHWFVGERISLADIALFFVLDEIDKGEAQKHLEKLPKLHQNHERVRSHLHSYLSSRT